MGRLIDADALLEKMKATPRYFDVKFDIEEMPIAYNVEKVVEQLVKASYERFGHVKDIDLDKAIEIVRNGGIE